MKKFLKNASLFVLLLLILCLALEFNLLAIPNEYSYKREYVEKNGENIKTLILGHSQAAWGLMPEEMGEGVFNMAISGRLLYYDAILAERYVPTLTNLECVVLPLGYNFIYLGYTYDAIFGNSFEICGVGKGKGMTASTYRCMYAKYMGIDYDGDLPFQYWSELLNSKLDYVGRRRKFYKRDYKRDFEKICQCNPTGYQKRALKSKGKKWKSATPPKIKYDHPDAEKAWETGVAYMKRIAEVCRKANVRLVVVTTPCYKTYVEQTTERGMQDLYRVIDSMRTVYPNVEYCNYINDGRFEDDDFIDSSHLSEYGAEKFSRIFRDEVLNKSRNR